MANILNSLRRLFKHRQHKRYFVTRGTFVVISSGKVDGRDREVQIIDISQGGMAFIYQGSPAELAAFDILKPHGTNIEFDTVSDISFSDSTQTSEPSRRRSVKFKWMGFYEQEELKDFINEIKTCEK